MAGKDTGGIAIAAVNGAGDGIADTDRKPESGSSEPQTFGFPAPISPIDAGFTAGIEPERPKRKYTKRTPIASEWSARSEKTTPDLSDLKALIYSAHQMMSAIVPELELDSDEAKRYADATQNLMKHYDHKVNPKVMAWLQFSCVIGGIYGPRAVAVYKRMETETVRKPDPQPINAPRPQERAPAPSKPWSETTPSELFGSSAAPIEDRR